MSLPSPPAGYDVSKAVEASTSNCVLTVGFDRQSNHIPRFIVQLHYRIDINPIRWEAIARMDHNETAALGHNIYQEGLHVDAARRSHPPVKLRPSHSPLPASRGRVIRACTDYLDVNTGYFVDVYEGNVSPGSPPRWPDGGQTPSRFIRSRDILEDMSRESTAEDPLSTGELTDLLADAEGTTPESIEHGAEEIEIAPPGDASVVDE
ncbi:hypothetical protein GCM10008995_16220 [Halobellus salinus]|uniref:DUF7718 domain-containing protein n=1 Tax=Halobellus salinus TaxID=931585 RepID=A0A830EFL5_9EURY|nr:hypothetical protein [Halobellus salinus]GGJ07124.1 hypothetical protein GCM10008995_16220 [Halobellus salinus]SMP25688.1 hypothetical protein SAMN06265347_1118 [Halobellus salinus]